MNATLHAGFRAWLFSACLFILAAPAMAGAEVEIYELGSGEALGYRIKNTSSLHRYQVDIEVKRLDLKSGDVVSSRLDTVTLSPLADIALGSAIQQNARVQYRVAKIRPTGKATGGIRRSRSDLPSPYPMFFNEK